MTGTGRKIEPFEREVLLGGEAIPVRLPICGMHLLLAAALLLEAVLPVANAFEICPALQTLDQGALNDVNDVEDKAEGNVQTVCRSDNYS
jgi:hypothetical protein